LILKNYIDLFLCKSIKISEISVLEGTKHRHDSKENHTNYRDD